MLSYLSVSNRPKSRLRHWCSSKYLRISPLHLEFHSSLLYSSSSVSNDRSQLSCEISHQRSEEHTSELQSRFDLVCRLLLEKKKNIYIYHKHCNKTT